MILGLTVAAIGAVVGVGYAGVKLVKKGCRKLKEVIKNRKNQEEEEA